MHSIRRHARRSFVFATLAVATLASASPIISKTRSASRTRHRVAVTHKAKSSKAAKTSVALPITSKGVVPSRPGLAKYSTAKLTAPQASFVSQLSSYLKSEGKSAVITSAARSASEQLKIIQNRVRQNGGSKLFPSVFKATVAQTSKWMKAWQWLRARGVPVYAPKSAPGTGGQTSKHLDGLAVDFMSHDLDKLHSWIANFANSEFAQKAALKIVSIAREPGCVHVNLTHNSLASN